MEISKKLLEELYHNNSNKYVCKKLGISHTTLDALIVQAGIKKKGKGNRITNRKKVNLKGDLL